MYNIENGFEDFFIIVSYAWFDSIDNALSNEVTLFISWDLNSTSIKQKLGFFASSINKAFNSLKSVSTIKRRNIDLSGSRSDGKSL